MTLGKPGSPVARALSKVTGATADGEQQAGTPVATATPSGQVSVTGAGAPPAPAAPTVPAPAAPASRNGSTPTAFPTAPVGTPPPAAPTPRAAAGPAGAAGVAGSAAGAAAYGSSAPYGTPTPAATQAATQAQPRPAAHPPAPTGRRVRLTVARVDPWSVMKISFLVSVAIGIAFVVMVAVLWLILDGMGVFSSLNRTIADIQGSTSNFDLMDYIDAHFEWVKAFGAIMLSEPEDVRDVGVRHYRAEDLEGHRWMFSQDLPS